MAGLHCRHTVKYLYKHTYKQQRYLNEKKSGSCSNILPHLSVRVTPRHHLTSLILKYAGGTLLGCSALVTQSGSVYWSPAECGRAACGLSWPAAPPRCCLYWPWKALKGPERPWEALLFKVSPFCHWGSWPERSVQRAFRAKTRRLKEPQSEPQCVPIQSPPALWSSGLCWLKG